MDFGVVVIFVMSWVGFVVLLVVALYRWLGIYRNVAQSGWKRRYQCQVDAAEVSARSYKDQHKKSQCCKNQRKPQWVKSEVIRFKAFQPGLSCRLIAVYFNQRFGQHTTISKSFVAYTLKQERYAVMQLRRKIKTRPAYPVRFNRVWGLDLTFIQHKPVLGMVEHHSRHCLSLLPLSQKTSVAILKALLMVLENTPKPTFIRTDNEVCFNSKLMRFALRFLGIKKQTTELYSPWQNGRVERFFGSLKQALKTLPQAPHPDDLPYLLTSFAFWYNHVRLHQNLNYQTPAQVFNQAINALYRQQQKPPDD